MSFSFKNWIFLKENIVIDDVGKEAALVHVPSNSIKEFNYQTENSYSTFFIGPYQAKRTGYLSISTQPTHVGITKTSPIEKGKGIDIAFLKSLTNNLNLAGFKPTPYKEGESSFANVAKDLELDDLQDKFKQAAEKDLSNPNVPDIKTGAANQQKITNSMSVSRASGSWSYFIQTSDANRIINAIISIMEKSAKPLLDNDLIDFYEVVDRMSGKRDKIVYSKKGESEHNDFESQYQKRVAYFKFLTETMLKNYPNAQKMIMNRINQVGVRVSGGGENPVQKISPSNNKVPLQDLVSLVKESYADDEMLLFFLDTLKSKGDYLYNVLERVSKEPNAGELLWQIDQLLKNKTDDFFANIDLHFHDAIQIFKNQKILKELVPNEFNSFKNQFEDGVNEFIKEGEITSRDIKYLKTLAQYIDIEAKDEIDVHHKKIEEKEKQDKIKQEQEVERKKFILHEDEVYYLVLSDNEKIWKPVPGKYINYNGEIEYGEFCLGEIVDSEEVFEDAYGKAMEDAQEHVKEKESENYGEDKEKVNDDIETYADDYINQTDEDIPENMSDEDLFKLIKDKHYKEFIKWRIGELKQEEEENSHEYEAEPEQEDIYKYEEELSVDVAFNNHGLVLLTHGNKEIDVEYSSKFENTMMPILKKALQISVKEKDREYNEPIVKRNKSVHFTYRDKNKYKIKTVQEIID